MNGVWKSRLGQCGWVVAGLMVVFLLLAATHSPSAAEKTKQNVLRVLQTIRLWKGRWKAQFRQIRPAICDRDVCRPLLQWPGGAGDGRLSR